VIALALLTLLHGSCDHKLKASAFQKQHLTNERLPNNDVRRFRFLNEYFNTEAISPLEELISACKCNSSNCSAKRAYEILFTVYYHYE
jgi:hypothetical protein